MITRKSKAFRAFFCYIIVMLTCSSLRINAQDSITTDSINKAPLVEQLQKMGRDEAKRSMEKFAAEKRKVKQINILQQLQEVIHQAKTQLKKGLDTNHIVNELNRLDKWNELARDGVFINKGTAHTFRNLTTTEKLLKELHKRATILKLQTGSYQKNLSALQFKVDSLYSDSVLFEFYADSTATVNYYLQLAQAVSDIRPTDSSLRQSLSSIEQIQIRINNRINVLLQEIEEVDQQESKLYSNTLSRDFRNIWEDPIDSRPIGEIVEYSWKKSVLTFYFYVQNHAGTIALVCSVIITLYVFLRSLKKLIAVQGKLEEDMPGRQLVLKYPLLSAYLVGSSLLQFLFPYPPFLFDMLIWISSAFSLTYILKAYITRYWMWIWLTLLMLFVVVSADNLILQASRIESWWICMLSLTGLLFTIWVLSSRNKSLVKEKAILYFITIVPLLELPALIATIFGRYNFGKTLLVSGFVNVIIAIIFLWVVRLINEMLQLASTAYNRQDGKLFYINFTKVGDKVPRLFYVFLVAGWFVLFGRNFYLYRLLTTPITDFFIQERTIGSFTFSFGSIFLFLLILFIATAISRLVSFFASDHPTQHHAHGTDSSKNVLGSWILLVRIFIISLGVFMAFAATGIAMDKLTIIIGALSVGIGLGLQALVNNLVSGLILAFEKPVNVGDLVQVANQYGRIKSIGFRGSIITTSEGADVTVPNGELLNSHIVNWTKDGRRTKRLDMIVGVGYDSNLEKTIALIRTIFEKDDRILSYPEPVVFACNFNSSSIDIQLLFWIKDLSNTLPVKSDVIQRITKLFKENGIAIPYPQQDVYIKNPPTARPDEKK